MTEKDKMLEYLKKFDGAADIFLKHLASDMDCKLFIYNRLEKLEKYAFWFGLTLIFETAAIVSLSLMVLR